VCKHRADLLRVAILVPKTFCTEEPFTAVIGGYAMCSRDILGAHEIQGK
jgi:hypothetical protein